MSAGLGEAVYLCGEITDSRRELWANVTYLLGCPVYVRDGATLVLEPGTMIAAVPKDPSHPDVPVLVVERGGRIIADCSAERPCTFTAANPGETESNEQVQTDSSSSATVVYGARGKWGGVVLAGRAPTALAEEPRVEGLDGVYYGGGDPDDSSGVLRYVRVWHAGAVISEDNEINGLTLAGVGRGTVVSHVEVAYSLDDGFEFFGGTVDVDHLSVLYIGDDAFDFDAGYRGRGQYLFAMLGSEGDHAIEADAEGANRRRSHPRFFSGTVIGAGAASRDTSMMLLRRQTGGAFGNWVLAGGRGPAVQLASCDAAVNVTQHAPALAAALAVAEPPPAEEDTLWLGSHNLYDAANPWLDVLRNSTDCAAADDDDDAGACVLQRDAS